MKLRGVALPCLVTPLCIVEDGTTDNEMKMLSHLVCIGFIKIAVVGSTVLPVTQIDSCSEV